MKRYFLATNYFKFNRYNSNQRRAISKVILQNRGNIHKTSIIRITFEFNNSIHKEISDLLNKISDKVCSTKSQDIIKTNLDKIEYHQCEQEEFMFDLRNKGHTCVKVSETDSKKVEWCRSNPCRLVKIEI